jgi:very-short-patch-repair endonuclease
VLRALDVGGVLSVLARLRGRRGPGARAIRAALGEHCGPVVLRSELERLFKELIDDDALPRGEHNVGVEGWEVDVCCAARRLVVELQSARFHSTPAARRRDREKEAALRAAGWRVVHYGWDDVTEGAEQTAAGLRALLTG